METIRRPLARSTLVAFFFAVLTFGAFLSTRYLYSSPTTTALMEINSPEESLLASKPRGINPPEPVHIPLNCSLGTHTCPVSGGPQLGQLIPPLAAAASCPEYFRWIHEDLRPWRETGVTLEMVMSAKPTANFRLVVVDGKAYVDKYRKSFQSRDTFTLWGILQLLRRNKLPDLDLMFNCDTDWPVIRKETFKGPAPPPLFRYCGDDKTYDVVFPDWSFWGWPEIYIKSWEVLSKELHDRNKRTNWTDREPHAYWKGNPRMAESRKDLLKCNVSEKQDWNARVFIQDWIKEQREGFKNSDLASQCTHRYNIYVEGKAWSVSEKYILACGSVSLFVTPHYYDFFTRSLLPLEHYWPINEADKCRSIKHAVKWGNSHQQEAQAIGKAASRFIQNDLKMDYVYDYMFHLLSEYSKLLTYKPTVPEKAVELCSESMACPAQGFEKQFMTESMVVGPKVTEPCDLPPPYDPSSLHSVIERRDGGIKQVKSWEREYWKSHGDKQT